MNRNLRDCAVPRHRWAWSFPVELRLPYQFHLESHVADYPVRAGADWFSYSTVAAQPDIPQVSDILHIAQQKKKLPTTSMYHPESYDNHIISRSTGRCSAWLDCLLRSSFSSILSNYDFKETHYVVLQAFPRPCAGSYIRMKVLQLHQQCIGF